MRVFLSDLHLEDPDSPTFRTFAMLLERESSQAESLFILGDLTEVWVGDDDDGPLARALRSVLAEASNRCSIYIMHGNRDFLLGESFAVETGVTLINDPLLLSDGTLVAHGDAFCIDDAAYQALREQFRSPSWQREILDQTLEARRGLAMALRTESRKANANKAANIMDVAEQEVARVVAQQGARRLIHGHTHRPGLHTCSWGIRYVLGAWETCGWLARQPQEGMEPQLECFPLIR